VRLVSGLGADAEIASVHPSGEPTSISGGRRCSALIALGPPQGFRAAAAQFGPASTPMMPQARID